MTPLGVETARIEWNAKIAAKGMRRWKEWVGKTPDAKVPDAVRARIFALWEGRCFITGVKLGTDDWDMDHVVPLADGGKHQESNLRPVWRPAHRAKTGKENSARAVVRRKQRAHLGLKRKPKKQIQSQPFAKAEPQHRASKPISKLAGVGRSEIARRYQKGE